MIRTSEVEKGAMVMGCCATSRRVAESIGIGILVAVVHGYPGGPEKQKFWLEVLRKLASIPNALGFRTRAEGSRWDGRWGHRCPTIFCGSPAGRSMGRGLCLQPRRIGRA